MSFRRDGNRANHWSKRLKQFPDLLQKTGLPDVVLASDRAWAVFLQEGCSRGPNTPLIDAMSYLSETQQAALHEASVDAAH